MDDQRTDREGGDDVAESREKEVSRGFSETAFWITLCTAIACSVIGTLTAIVPAAPNSGPRPSIVGSIIEGWVGGAVIGFFFGAFAGLGVAALRMWKK